MSRDRSRASRVVACALAAGLVGLVVHAAEPRPPAAAPSAAAGAAVPVPLALTADDVRHHLGHVIDWYHRLGGLPSNDALADDLVTRERLHQLRLTEVRLAFGFGRAAAALIEEDPAEAARDAGAAEDGTFRYERMLSRMDERERELRAQVARLDGELARATPQDRPVLAARRAQVAAALTLTSEVQATVKRLQQFATRSNSSASGETGLRADITDMERTVPEARINPPPARAAGAGVGVQAVPAIEVASTPPQDLAKKDTGGLIAFASEWFALRDALQLHQHYIDATVELSAALDKLSSGLATQVRELLRATATAAGEDARELAAARSAVEAATTRFRELSTLLIPLGEESITLDTAREQLEHRREGLEQRANAVARNMAVRATVLVLSIALILGISALWRRATFRYLHDPRRRRQFLTLRRVATGAALVIVAVMAFMSEIGSLATYIGFLTAGIAVALQNVILATVAYFFLIGRHGVRVGDRVTMAGVTGRVVEIGLVRIYLAELAGPDLTPTGRMIVLSNAVIFQPSALFKQVPGVDYTWHSTSFTLAPNTDVTMARSRLQERADRVFETYRSSIEAQLRASRHMSDFESGTPRPEVSARYTDRGVALTVRYPVQPDQAATVDQHMARELRASLDEAPPLQLASVADASPAG